MMVIVPVNAHKNKAQDVAEEFGQKQAQSCERPFLRRPQLQDHNGDNDRENAITEGFQPALAHKINSPDGFMVYGSRTNSDQYRPRRFYPFFQIQSQAF